MIDIEEGSPHEDVQRKQQMLMQEEYDMEHLQERQRQINQLEVMMKEIRFKILFLKNLAKSKTPVLLK